MPGPGGFGEDALDPRIVKGVQFLNLLNKGYSLIGELNQLKVLLLALRAEVVANKDGIFILPDDLNYADAQLLALRNALQTFVNSLPGGP